MARGVQARAFYAAAGLCAVGGGLLGLMFLSSRGHVARSTGTTLLYMACVFLSLVVFFLSLSCCVRCGCCARRRKPSGALRALLGAPGALGARAELVFAEPAAEPVFAPAEPRPPPAWAPAVLASRAVSPVPTRLTSLREEAAEDDLPPPRSASAPGMLRTPRGAFCSQSRAVSWHI